jgi:hypothetical protein
MSLMVFILWVITHVIAFLLGGAGVSLFFLLLYWAAA